MTELYDITVPIKRGMPIWPGTVEPKLWKTMSMKNGDSANVSRIDIDVHTGTHVDAPRHFLEEGKTVDQLMLEDLIGFAMVANIPHVTAITESNLDNLNMPVTTERILLRTRNSDLWAAGETEFKKNYVALTADAARWFVMKGIKLVGVDYLSVECYGESYPAHEILLEAGVIIVECLNLSGVKPGTYELICLPINIVGAEGAPARVLLRSIPDNRDRLTESGGGL
ncbi:cyclase family protein [uncultured Desulfosarcina sp.]|uniref:cyclase family protein n=1 Tax=uncultured Desulfosarcina sp. TaxID=218289 RepID=UPI0029C7FAE1|nr:cyclase family protein [uncultured Desulfosarcina sp.]